MPHPAIVIIAYNRPHCLKRLLASLQKATFPQEPTTLIISIDKSDEPQVLELAQDFNWKNGEKRIIRHEERLGLMEHQLRCGDLTTEFGAAIVLEDDIVVSPCFYNYAQTALTFYEDHSKIGGVSLYHYEISENEFYPFQPIDDGGDTYFMQFAASWGRAWTAKQWTEYREWL